MACHRPRILSVALMFTAACTAPWAHEAPSAAPHGDYVLAGRVVDSAGRPLADIPVRTFGGFATRWETGATRTDDTGCFRFPGATGSWIGDDDAQGRRTAYVGVCAGECDGGNPAASLPWQDVRVAPGVPMHVEFVLASSAGRTRPR